MSSDSRVPFYLLSALYYLGIPALSFVSLALCAKRRLLGVLVSLLFLIFAAAFLAGAAENICWGHCGSWGACDLRVRRRLCVAIDLPLLPGHLRY
jgi:hypothetical protein